MFIKWWARGIILVLSILFFIYGTAFIVTPDGSDNLGYVFWVISIILVLVFKSASRKARIYKNELIREKARNDSRYNNSSFK